VKRISCSGKNQEFENAYRQAGSLLRTKRTATSFRHRPIYEERGLSTKRKTVDQLSELLRSQPYYCFLGDIQFATKSARAFAENEKPCEYNPPHAAAI
jgi:hypothetical protein